MNKQISAEERARNYFVGFYCGNDICEDDDWEINIQELAREFRAHGKQERNAARREDVGIIRHEPIGASVGNIKAYEFGKSVRENIAKAIEAKIEE